MSPARVVLVTGGTRGIGFGICTALAREGCALALCGRRPPAAVADAVQQLRDRGASDVAYWQADVGAASDRQALVEGVLSRLGGIHALVNNAGMAPRVRADLLEAGEESFQEVLRTNLQGPYFLTQQVSRLLVDRKQADPSAPCAIVFVTSISAEVASTNRGEYCVSKAGLAMTAQLFAVRLAALAIPVFEVRPGVIATDMTARVKDRYDRLIADGLIPEGRWGTPDDVGRAVAALLRGDVPYATGSVIHVAGGMQLGRM